MSPLTVHIQVIFAFISKVSIGQRMYLDLIDADIGILRPNSRNKFFNFVIEMSSASLYKISDTN